MKYILIILIFASFLFSQVATAYVGNSIEQVVKEDPRISSSPNNILLEDNTQMLENGVTKEDPKINSSPNNILLEDNTQMLENEGTKEDPTDNAK